MKSYWAPNMPADGNIVVDENPWPGGMKAIADYIHSKGLKAGIYTDAGTAGCGLQVYGKVLSGTGKRAVMLFNRTGSAANITVDWADLGLTTASATVRNAWPRTDAGSFTTGYTASVPANDAGHHHRHHADVQQRHRLHGGHEAGGHHLRQRRQHRMQGDHPGERPVHLRQRHQADPLDLQRPEQPEVDPLLAYA